MAVLSQHDPKTLLSLSIGPACHELRSPLAVVYGFAKMLENAEGLDESTQRYVNAIVNSSQRLDELLDCLSKIGRIAAGRISPSVESVSVRAIVEDLCSTTRNVPRVKIEQGDDVNVKTDPAWLSESFQGVIDSLCFEPDMSVRINWTHDAHEVAVNFMPGSSFPMVESDPGKCGLLLALARMRVVAMGGALEGHDDRVTVLLPRH